MLLSIEVLPTYFHFPGNRKYPPRASPFKFLIEKRHIGGNPRHSFHVPSLYFILSLLFGFLGVQLGEKVFPGCESSPGSR